MFGFSFDKIIIGAIASSVAIIGLMAAGNHYGPNAIWRAHREAEDKAKNAAITFQNQQENDNGLREDKRLLDADKEFMAVVPTLPSCILTAETIQAINPTGN